MQSDSSMVMRTGVPLSTWLCSMRTSSTSHMKESEGDMMILLYTKCIFITQSENGSTAKKIPVQKI